MNTPPPKPVEGNGPHGYKSWSRRKKILVWAGGGFAALVLASGISNAVNPPKPVAAAHVTQSAAAMPAPKRTQAPKVAAKVAPKKTTAPARPAATAKPAPATPVPVAPAAAAGPSCTVQMRHGCAVVTA